MSKGNDVEMAVREIYPEIESIKSEFEKYGYTRSEFARIWTLHYLSKNESNLEINPAIIDSFSKIMKIKDYGEKN